MEVDDIPMLAQVMNTYLNITTEEEAQKWIKKQECGRVKKKKFMKNARQVLRGEHITVSLKTFDETVRLIHLFRHEDTCINYLDHLRVSHESNGSATR